MTFEPADSLAFTGDPRVIKPIIRAFKVTAEYIPDGPPPAGPEDALVSMGETAVVPLCRALHDDDWRIRGVAAVVLGWIGDPRSFPAIGRLLRDRNSDVRRAACRALAHIGTPAAKPWLLQAFRSPDEGVRGVASIPLVELADSSDFPAMLAALKDPVHEVRANAARALGVIGNPQAVPKLLSVVHDRHSEVREQAVLALGALRSSEALPLIRSCVLDSMSPIRYDAVHALMAIGPPDAAAVLEQALTDTMDARVRIRVAAALARLGNVRGIDELAELACHADQYDRRRAIDSLGEIGASTAFPALARVTRDHDQFLRRDAFDALAKLNDDRAESLILAVATDTTSANRYDALRAIGSSSYSWAFDLLTHALEVPDRCADEKLLDAAIVGFGGLGDPRAVHHISSALCECMPDRIPYPTAWDLAWSLGSIADSSCVEPLMTLNKRSRGSAEDVVLWALERIGPPHAIAELRAFLRRADPNSRIEAARILRSWGYTLCP